MFCPVLHPILPAGYNSVRVTQGFFFFDFCAYLDRRQRSTCGNSILLQIGFKTYPCVRCGSISDLRRLIVMGNDILKHYTGPGVFRDVVLQVGYEQWLPVCAVSLCLTIVVYTLLIRVIPVKIPLLLSCLFCGLLSISSVLLTGILSVSFSVAWYEMKNMTTFFAAGFAYALLLQWLD